MWERTSRVIRIPRGLHNSKNKKKNGRYRSAIGRERVPRWWPVNVRRCRRYSRRLGGLAERTVTGACIGARTASLFMLQMRCQERTSGCC